MNHRNLMQTPHGGDGVPRHLIVDPRAELREFLAAFGPAGAEYCAAGLSFEEAAGRRIKDLADENDELKRRLGAAEFAGA
ncbi:MAG: hypothetical protein KDA44_09400 [Planctomycetales bacterium]|nr:hypothetical protein [Planctomycetales bacterium]